jgi:hypothetical protein
VRPSTVQQFYTKQRYHHSDIIQQKVGYPVKHQNHIEAFAIEDPTMQYAYSACCMSMISRIGPTLTWVSRLCYCVRQSRFNAVKTLKTQSNSSVLIVSL